MYMIRISTKFSVLFMALFSWATIATAQNLVPNGNFDTFNCPTTYTGIATQVSANMPGWYSSNCASPDVFSNCGVTTGGNRTMAPDVIFGYQYARSGNGFMGLGFYSGWFEYMGAKLTQPLEAGEVYKVSFWVACADNIVWAADEIGAYFSTSLDSCKSGFGGTVFNYTPQFVNEKRPFITDTVWTEVKREFVAAGGEEYITLGYFKPIAVADFYKFPDPGNGLKAKANPNYQPTVNGTGTATSPRAYYYIDDVVVEKQNSLPVQFKQLNYEVLTNGTRLNWTTASEINNCEFVIEKSNDGGSFKQIGSVKGTGNSSRELSYSFTDNGLNTAVSYYRIRQVDCDGRYAYSNIVKVVNKSDAIKIYPNPANQFLVIELPAEETSAAVNIYSIDGKRAAALTVTGNQPRIDISKLPAGSYFINITSKGQHYSQKFVKE